MEIGESIELDGVTYKVKKKISEYVYEICNTKNGEVLPYAVGRSVDDKYNVE